MTGLEAATPELTLSPDKAYFILLRARAFDEKVENTDPDSGSDPADDRAVDVLEQTGDDATEAELVDAVDALNDDERLDLIALIWIGRGDFAVDEWSEARNAARDITRERAPRYVTGIPLVSDYLEDGLSQAGFALADFVDAH